MSNYGIFNYDPNIYIPKIEVLRSLILPDVNTRTKKGRKEADRMIRAEYSRLRAIAVKRLERLSRSEFKGDMPYTRYKDRFIKLSEMKRPSDVAHLLSDVVSFLSMKSSTIKGAKEVQSNILAGLREHGVDFVDESNLRSFGDFMTMLRSKLLDRIYDSERAYKVWTQARKLGMKWHGDLEDEFDFFYNNSKTMQKLTKLKDKTQLKRGQTLAKYYREKIENWHRGKDTTIKTKTGRNKK